MTAATTGTERTVLPWDESPATPSPEYSEMLPAILLCRDVMGGTERMREKRFDYLPKGTGENSKQYNARIKLALLVNFLKRTVNGLIGMVCRVPPRLSLDAPEILKEHWENLDNAGTPGPQFLKDWGREALIAGHSGVLVDYPVVTPGLGVNEVKALGVRPFWVRYSAEDIFRLEPGTDHGRLVIQRLVLRETLRSAAYTSVADVQFRVFIRGPDPVPGAKRKTIFEVWTPAPGEPRSLQRTNTGLIDQAEVPFVLLVAERGEGGVYGASEPPLEDLAYANIAHYQSLSDLRHAVHIGCIPIPTFTGRSTDKKTENTNGIDLPIGATFTYTEPAGHAYAAARTEVQDLEQRIAMLGLAMLQRQSRAAETAEARGIDKSESDSALASFAGALESAATGALKMHAAWLDLDSAKVGKITVSRDFLGIRLSAQDVTALVTVRGAGDLSQGTFWDILERGDVLPPGFDRDKEKVALEAEAAARPPMQLTLFQPPAPGAQPKPAEPPVPPGTPKAEGTPPPAPPGATPPAPPRPTP